MNKQTLRLLHALRDFLCSNTVKKSAQPYSVKLRDEIVAVLEKPWPICIEIRYFTAPGMVNPRRGFLWSTAGNFSPEQEGKFETMGEAMAAAAAFYSTQITIENRAISFEYKGITN